LEMRAEHFQHVATALTLSISSIIICRREHGEANALGNDGNPAVVFVNYLIGKKIKIRAYLAYLCVY
jgi:hypothetical protein